MQIRQVIYTLSLALSLSACSQNLPSAATDASSTSTSSATSGTVSTVSGSTSSDTSTVVVSGSTSSTTTTTQLNGILDLSGAAVTSGTSYYLRNLSTGNCLDVQGDLTINGTHVQPYTCGAGKPNQEWTIHANGDGTSVNLISVHSGRSLDLATQGIGTSNQYLQIYDYFNAGNQNFTIVPVSGGGYHIRSVLASTQCVEDSGAINAQTCVVTASQTYELIPLSLDPAQ